MKPHLLVLLFSLLHLAFTRAAPIYIGDGAASESDLADSGVPDTANSGNMTYVFTSDRYANNSGEPVRLGLSQVNFWADAAGTVTPFVARYSGGPIEKAESYTVVLVGDPINAMAGESNNAAFTSGDSEPVVMLEDGEALIAGFHQSARVVPFANGGSADYLQRNSSIPGSVPDVLTADANWFTLSRTYAFNIGLELVSDPQSPTGILLNPTTIPKDTEAGGSVGLLSALDPNGADQHSFELVNGEGDSHNALFTIDGNSVQLSQALPEGVNQLFLRVKATDLSGLSVESLFSLTVLQPAVRLSELAAKNDTGLKDSDGDTSDWIEIVNDRASEINLEGWYLTDDPDNLTRWQFPSKKLSAGEFLVVFASGKNRASILDKEIHTDFNLSSGGEYLALVRSDGETVASEFAPNFPEQADRISYGFDANGNETGYFFPPTPGEANTQQPSPIGINFTHFSVQRGLYDEPFSLEMTPTVPGSTIRYTTNGTEPTLFTSKSYDGPITIDETMTIRARSSGADGRPSPLETHTFIFLDDVIEQKDMSTRITENDTWGPQLRDALLAIPTVSLVTKHKIDTGVSPEVPVSMELIFPDGSPGFQVDCGVEHFGGTTLNYSPKKNMRLSFKQIYGPGRLNYDLFGDGATTSFDQILLRSGSHDTWLWAHTSGRRGIFIRGRWAFDRQLEMGQPAPRGRWVHAYINGNYHGLHHLMERPNDAFMASYFGGEQEEYEALVAGTAVDGDGSAWRAINDHKSDYNELIRYMNVVNYADYMLLQFYGGNDWDWNVAANWSAAGPKLPDQGPGYQFFSWDSDVMLRSGPTANVINRGGPGNLWGSIKRHDEFLMVLADRAYGYFFNDGMLTRDRVFAQLEELAARIELPIIAECARWGARVNYTPTTWRSQIDNVKNTIVDGRTEIVIKQMQDADVYPTASIPKLNQTGGSVSDGFNLTLSLPTILARGTIYFTFDGSDPRLPGGEPNPNAQSTTHRAEVTLKTSLTLKARFLSRTSDEWSPLIDTFFAVGAHPPQPGDLVVSEIHFNPDGNDATEFIELKNLSDTNLTLDGLQLVDGVRFAFPDRTVLEADQHVVIAGEAVAFAEHYSSSGSPWYFEGIRLAGDYAGSLNNDGETLTLLDANGEQLLQFDFNDAGRWPGRADGNGSSVELENLSEIPTVLDELNRLVANGNRWRPSSEFGGSPGRAGNGPDNRVVINEVATDTTSPAVDVIELYNTTSESVDLSGWFLTDSSQDLRKFEIPAGTELAPGAFLLFDEGDFNDPESATPFALDSINGDQVALLESDADGNLLGFVDRVEFGAAANGETFGRWPDGRARLYPMKKSTLGQKNTSDGNSVRVGTVIITEIHYNPSGDDEGREFIEIINAGSAAEDLSNWRLRGEADFDFPQETLEPSEILVLVGFNPNETAKRNAFLAAFPTAAANQLRGAWDAGATGNQLDAGGAAIRLQRPGERQILPNEPPFYSMLVEDTVNYDDESPWPTGADGIGSSITRQSTDVFGDDAANWQADAPTPGTQGSPVSDAYNDWAANHDLGDGRQAMPHADFDRDGLMNLIEFAINSNPKRAEPASLPVAGLTADRHLTLTFRKRNEPSGFRYETQVSSDMRDWATIVTEIASADNGDGTSTVTVRDNRPLGGTRFARLRVVEEE